MLVFNHSVKMQLEFPGFDQLAIIKLINQSGLIRKPWFCVIEFFLSIHTRIIYYMHMRSQFISSVTW